MLVAEPPAILLVCQSGPDALLVTVVHGLPDNIHAELIRLVVAAFTLVKGAWGGVEICLPTEVVIEVVLDKQPLLAEAFQIKFLKTVLHHPPVLLQSGPLKLRESPVLLQVPAVQHLTLLLLPYKLLLPGLILVLLLVLLLVGFRLFVRFALLFALLLMINATQSGGPGKDK